MAIIKLTNGPTQLCSILVKPYYNPAIEIDENLDNNMKNTLLEMYDNLEYQDISLMHVSPNIWSTLISSLSLVFSMPHLTLSSLLSTPVKYGQRRPQKYLIDTNFLTSSDIYFIMDHFHYDNINMRLLPYILLKQKEILGLLEKEGFKVVSLEDVLVYMQVSNSQFINGIKNVSIDRYLRSLI